MKNIKIKYPLYSLLITIISFYSGCQESFEDGITLEYDPEVGKTYNIKVTDLSKNITANGFLEVLEKKGDNYIKKVMLKNVEEYYMQSVIETFRLNFPDRRIKKGDEWEGNIPYNIYNNAHNEEFDWKVIYKLNEYGTDSLGRYCIINCYPELKEINFDGLIGEIGIKMSDEAIITEISSVHDAVNKLRVGDEVLRINNEYVDSKFAMFQVKEKIIEPPKENKTVTLKIKRDDEIIDVEVNKKVILYTNTTITPHEPFIQIIFDIDRGIIRSYEEKIMYIVIHEAPSEGSVSSFDDIGTRRKEFTKVTRQTGYYWNYKIVDFTS
ncbi:hypothetical protein ACFLS9_04145 [Bacteroidota bacterium]